MHNRRQIAPTVKNTPKDDPDSVPLRLVNEEPGPDGKGSRRAVEIFANATYPRPIGETYDCRLDPTQHQLGAINAMFTCDAVEHLHKVVLGLKRRNDGRMRHRGKILVGSMLSATFGDDVFNCLR